MTTASGTQILIRGNGLEAVVASVGASLRVLRDGRGDLTVPFDADEIRPAMRGAVLAPWPNRIADGRFTYAGEQHQLAVTEPATSTAAHGLVAWSDFAVREHGECKVHLSTVIDGAPGYPWRVRIDAEFEIVGRALHQRLTATNESLTPAPVGLGGHPYLTAGHSGANTIDDWYLEMPADEVMLVSAERMLPTGVLPVTGDFDFRVRRPIGTVALNNAFGALRYDQDGFASVRMTDRDGDGVALVFGEGCRWVQLYSADYATGEDHRSSLAVEPMTCPPDAMNSGIDLVVLEPGDSHSIAWSIGRCGPLADGMS